MEILSPSEEKLERGYFTGIFLVVIVLFLFTISIATSQYGGFPAYSENETAAAPYYSENETALAPYIDNGTIVITESSGYSPSIPYAPTETAYSTTPASSTPIWQANTIGASSSSQTSSAGLWIAQTLNSQRSNYIIVGIGSNVPLVSYSPTGGVAKIYDIIETSESMTGAVTSLNLQTGFTQGSYQATELGSHQITLRVGSSNSQPITVDVV